MQLKKIFQYANKLFFLFLAVVFLIFPLSVSAQDVPQNKPLRVAILAQDIDELPEDAQEYFAREVRLMSHIPLNKTLKAVEYIDNHTAADALAALASRAEYQRKRKPDYKAIMQPLAAELGAGLVLFFNVDYAYEMVYHIPFGEDVIDAGVQISLYGWDVREAAAGNGTVIADDKPAKKSKKQKPAGLISRTVNRRINDVYFGQSLSTISAEAVDYLLAAENLHERIYRRKSVQR